MSREEHSPTHATDAHIDELLQNLAERQRSGQGLIDVPELRLAQDIRRAYQTEALEDARSLERVLAKLTKDQVSAGSNPLALLPISRQTERISTMQHTLDTRTDRKSRRKWQPPALLAAAVFLALLVGGLLTALGVVHVSQTSPTASVVSQVITSVALSDNTNLTTQTSPVQHFAVGQTVWLVLNVGKMKGPAGILSIKWYENDHLYATSTRDFQTAKGQAIASASKAIPVREHQVFTQPGNGKVELYWNDQLVKTLYFVVK